ncbi:Carbohydrate-binding family 9 [Halopelagius inordinatus]|uniref:Carbohydrate-binding family 9 n=1 Tax=Halopelagius inordinatus TaxID=553467 RepID=A0A1I2UAU5_9EURY|nr:carbohydrate-binding family 9-like protein [Halopelagius inordinatus]SFG71926.1 Carbohydrate-binding family 9 [Halopelagius inordinatus]
MKRCRVVRVDETVPLDGVVEGTPWEAAEAVEIDEFPWGPSDAERSAVVRSLYDEDALYLQYRVEEDRVRAETSELNGPVWEDSCVELFATLEPGRRPHYVNFEVNCVGAFRLGFGPDRDDRELISPELADSVRVATSVDGSMTGSSGVGRWWVAAALPFETLRAFTGVPTSPEEGTVWRGNFHRLGDGGDALYATWNPVDAPTPDFHRPSQFGELVFGRAPDER